MYQHFLKKIFAFLAALFCHIPVLPAQTSTGFSSPVTLNGRVHGYPNSKIYFLRYNNSKLFAYEIADSAVTDNEGKFVMLQPATPGMYRICQGKAGWYSGEPGNTLHLWLGFNEEVAFEARVNDLSRTVQFTKGNYNTWWYNNETAIVPYQQKLGICMQLLDMYPKETGKGSQSPFYSQVQEEYLRQQAEVNKLWRDMIKKQKENTLASLQKNTAVPLTGTSYLKNDRTNFWREHLLDSVDFSNSILQNSHLAGKKLEQYMEMFGFPYEFATAQEADSGLLPAVKGILRHCKDGLFSKKSKEAKTASLQFAGAWLYRFCVDKGLDKCLEYAASEMTDDVFTNTCNASQGTLQTLERMQLMQRLKTGMPAPDILLNASQGKRLYDITAKKTLVVFWASWCTHCQQELPQLKRIYDSTGHKNWEVAAISIDTSIQAWTAAIIDQKFNWINYCDGKGWETQPAKEYGVFSTPLMFLLDEQKRIIAKPRDAEELKKWLE